MGLNNIGNQVKNQMEVSSKDLEEVGNPIPEKPNSFLEATKEEKRGIGDMLMSPSPRLKGFLQSGETKYIDTSEFRKYIYPDKKDSYMFPYQSDYHKSRAINQSNWEQFGHAAAKIIPNTILEFAGMVGNTLDFEDYVNSDAEVGNWLNTWAQEQKAKVNEALPIYRENPDKALDVGDFAWWMENGSALVESAAAFVGVGYLTGGASLSLLSNTGKALEFLNLISKGARAADATKKATRIGAGLMNTLMLNQAEGISIATQTYDNVFRETLEKLKATSNESEEVLIEQAKDTAAKKAASAINFNRINMLLNLTSSFAFLKQPKLTRNLVSNPSLTKSARTSLLEGLQEAGEETINMIAQNQAEQDNYEFSNALNDILSREGAEAAFLGFIGGAGQTMLTNAGRELKIRRDENGQRVSENDMQRQRFAEQEIIKARWENLSKADKFSDVSDVYMKSEEAMALYKDLNKAIKEDNNNKVTEIKNTLLRNQAYDAFSSGTTEQLINVFKGISELTEEEASAKGLDVATYKEDSTNAINTITALENEYNKAQGYVDSYSIYENRANNHFLNEFKTKRENLLEEERLNAFKDLQDLGIDETAISINDNGGIRVEGFSKLSNDVKQAVNNLESVKNYGQLNKEIESINKDIAKNTNEYAELTSDAYQEKVLNKIKEEIQQAKDTKRKQETQQKQDVKEENKRKKKESFKKEVPKKEEEEVKTPVETVEEIHPTSESESASENTFKFPLQGDAADQFLSQLEKKENEFYNSNKNINTKIKHYEEQLNRITQIDGLQDNVKSGISIQYHNALRELQQQQSTQELEKAKFDAAKNNAVNSLNELADGLENLAPLEEDSNFKKEDKIFKQINLVNKMLDDLAKTGMDITSFPSVAIFAQEVLGKDRFLKLFNDFKDIYNLSRRSPVRATQNYEDIFYTPEEKQNIIEGEAKDLANTYLSELYSLSVVDFQKAVENTTANFLKKQGYTAYNSDGVTMDYLKIVEGYNTLAHLDKLYKTNIKVAQTGRFNVLDFIIKREDLDRMINSKASDDLLDYDVINEGSKIEFKVLDEVVLDDGTIISKDGKVERNGVITQEDPVEVAPIGIIYNGKVLEGAFLHVPAWINEMNIADASEVETQRAYLRTIRQYVLDAPNQAITTSVVERTDGHLMFDPSGEMKTVKENMPNVDIAIGKDSQLYTGKDTVVYVSSDRLPVINSGWVYAVFPVNKGAKMAMPVYPTLLKDKPEIVDSIIEAVRLYLNNNIEDKRTKELFDKTNINITTMEGLRLYLNKFLYLNPNLDFEFNSFKNFVINADEHKSIIRIAKDNIEFGRGAGIGGDPGFINRNLLNTKPNRNELIDALLKDFRKVLENNTYLNVKKEFLNKDFTLPIISSDKVNVTKLKYNDFVKENTLTSQYSVKLKNDKDIYTIQSNLKFNTDFAFNPTISKEIEEEAFGKTETQSTKEENITDIKFGNETLKIDFDMDLGDLAPKENNNQIEYTLKSIEILQSDKAIQVFEKGKKNGWDLNKILTELQIPKEQKQLILDKNFNNINKFQNSKVKEVVFHGGRKGIKSFLKKGDEGYIANEDQTQNGIYFSSLKDVAKTYADDIQGEIYEVNINLENPYYIRFDEKKYKAGSLTDEDLKELKEKGHDGIIVDFGTTVKNYVVFNNNQVNIIPSDLREQIITDLLSNYSYTVEINTAKIGAGSKISEVRKQGERYIIVNTYGGVIADFKTEEEAAKYLQKEYDANTQHYSNLTVPGGTNYTENEISTPLITPSIKGHAQFSTDNGIGWFRSDEQTIQDKSKDLYDLMNRGLSIEEAVKQRLPVTKTRRILEVQSDLFQKGRDEDELVNSKDIIRSWDNSEFQKLIKDNQFLQLLNKDNNWVTFFVKSIIQDSAKKGYEKVLFPSGNTASKVEGHTTLEEFKREKENRIDLLQKQIQEEEIIYNKVKDFPEEYTNSVSNEDIARQSLDRQSKKKLEIEQLKQELERVETEGFGALKPIYNFYENTIANILKKNGYNPIEITDEYGNTWNEISLENIDTNINLAPLELSEEQNNQFQNTTPPSLTIQGVSLYVQETIINYLTYNIIKDVVKEGNTELAFDYVTDFKNILKNAREQYKLAYGREPRESLKNSISTLDSIIENYPKLEFIVLDKLRTYNNLKINGKNFERLKSLLEDRDIDEDILEGTEEEIEDTSFWNDSGIFEKDFRDKMSLNLKNYLSSILDVASFTYEDGVRKAVTKTSPFLGIEIPVPFDHVVNEISGILSYNNFEINTLVEPTFESMINVLEEWVETKPFLHNVIEQLNKADDKIKNEFVAVMSKHYTNHIYAYRNKKGKIVINNSDNNAIIKVIQNEWLNNIKESNLVITNNDKEYIINPTEVAWINSEVKDLIELLKTNSPITEKVEKAKTVLDLMGFKFSTNIIKDIETNGIQYGAFPYKLLHLFVNSDGAFKVYLNELNKLKEVDIEEKHPFANNTALNKFTRVLAKQNPTYFANSFRDVRGRLYYAYSANKFIVDRFKDLKNDSNLLDKLSKQPFSKNSVWLNELMTNPVFKRHFQYFTIDGLSIQNTKGKKLDNLSPAEYEEMKVNLFFSQNRKGTDYIINTFYPTTSDKTVQYGIKSLGKKWSKNLDMRNRPTDAMVDELFNILVQPEIDRIINVQNNLDGITLKNYKEGGTMFHIIPNLNSIKELYVEDSHTLVADINTNEALKTLMKKELRKYIVQLAYDKVEKWKKLGLTDTREEQIVNGNVVTDVLITTLKYNKSEDSNIAHDAYDYVLNYLVSNMNTYQLFTTDPAFYWKSNHWRSVANRVNKENPSLKLTNRDETLSHYTAQDWLQEHEDLFDNMGKRLGADSAPGTDIPDSPNNSFKLGILADREKESTLKDYFKGLLEIDYPKVNATDAQEFTTLKEHLYLMNKQGMISTKDMKRILVMDNNNEKFEESDLRIILQPMKPVYAGNVWTNGIENRLYVKSSSFPLFKQLTKGLEIDKLRVAMEKGGFDRVAFESAVKVGGIVKPLQIFNSKGEISKNFDITPANEGNPISRKGFKIQQPVPYKETQEINDGTQQRKLLTAAVRNVKKFKIKGEEGNYTGQQIQDKIDETYNKLFRIKYDELLKEIDYNVFEGTIGNYKDLERILQEEALTRKYSIYDLESLKMENGEFAVPLWLTGVSGKIESMLNSIVDNRIRKYKPKGQSFVLGTSEGFKPVLEGKNAIEYIRNTSGINYDKQWFEESGGELRPMRVVDGVVYPAEVMLPFKMVDSKGNKLDIKKYIKNGYINPSMFDDSVLELFGFRIPTQNLNSMAYIKIVGFLPEASGDLLLAPSEWTVKMGSDFDIDKLYSLLYNIEVDALTNQVKRYSGEDEYLKLQNYLLDLHFAILKNPNKIVQKEIARPLSFGRLIDKDSDTDLVREIYPYIEDRRKGISASEEYQTFKYRNGRAGKAGIGVFSTDSVFNAIIQGKNVYLQTIVKGEAFPIQFKLGNKWSNLMSDPKTNTGKYKANVIEAFQSLSVDNENEQGLHKLNINSRTFDAIRGLVFHGFDEDYITYFINQPIIRKYIELKEIQEDSVTNYTIEDLNKEIETLFPLTDVDFNNNFSIYEDTPLEQLKAIIQNPVQDYTQLDTNLQRFFLKTFERVSKYGQTIKSIQSAVNTDSAGLGKDLFYSFEKENQILELANKSNIANADKLIGEYVTLQHGQGQTLSHNTGESPKITALRREWFEERIGQKRKKEIIKEFIDEGYIPVSPVSKGKILNTINLIKPTTISGFASTYALILNNNLWNRYFPYNSTLLKRTLKRLSEASNRNYTTITEKAELNRTLFNNVKSFLITKASDTYTNADIYSERQRLLIDTPNNKSLASIVKELVESGKLNNAFVNRLQFDINKEVLPSNITYQANVAENIDERGIYAAFSKMFTDTKPLGTFNNVEYTAQKIAQDLVTHQMLTGGIQKAHQFIKYIPVNYLQLVGYYDFMKNIDFNNEEDINFTRIENQYLQHNPKEVLLSSSLKEVLDSPAYKFYNNDTVIRNIDTTSESLPFVFSVVNERAVKGYDIYFYNSDTRQWEQKDTLGRGDILEYDTNKDFGNTIIPTNKTREVKEITLPTNIKEIEVSLKLSNQVNNPSNVVYDPEAADIVTTYGLNNNETSLYKLSFILDRIVENNYNDFNSYLAQELRNNIDNLKEYRFIVNHNLQAKGRFSIADKTIEVNPSNIQTKQEFERVMLEEIIHAFTKKAIMDNSTGEILRLKGLRQEAIEAVKEYLGPGADIKIGTTVRKLKEGIALNSVEANIIYPILNDEEFIGRLFKSKELQEILNSKKSNIKGKSILEKLWDYVREVLSKVGINIEKGSILDYALTDIISLIKQPAPDSSITGEIQKKKNVTRTKEYVIKKFKLQDENGKDIKYDNASEIAKYINNNISNIKATVKNKKITLEYLHEQLDVFNEFNKESLKASLEEELYNLEMSREGALQSSEYIIVNNLPKISPESARKETGLGIGTKKDINPSFLSKNGKSVEAAAEYLKQNYLEYYPIEEDEIRDIIIDILTSGSRKSYEDSITNESRIKEIKKELKGDLAPQTTQSKVAPLLRSLNNRIFTLEKNIEKANQRQEFDKVAALTEQLEALEARRDAAITTDRLREIAVIGKQDMQEIAEMFTNKISLEDTLYIRKTLHFWKSAIDNLFDEEEKQSNTLVNEFKEIEAKALGFETKLEHIEMEYANNLLKQYGNNMTVEEIFYHFKDINGLTSYVLDISRSKNELLDVAFLLVKNANIDALDETQELLADLDSLEKKIKPLLNSKEPYDIFRQRTENGSLTGHLVSRYSHKYQREERAFLNKLNDNNNRLNYVNLVRWANNNVEHIKLNYLFPYTKLDADTTKKAEAYKKELETKLGTVHYNEFMADQKSLIDLFNLRKKGYLDYLMREYKVDSVKELLDISEASKRYKMWLAGNSPYQLYNQITNNTPKVIGENSKYKSHKYVTFVPNKDIHYDNNFKRIESNKDLLEFYNYYNKVDHQLRQILPEKEKIGLAINGIPYVTKVLLEAYKDKGMKIGLLPVLDAFKDSIRRNEEGIIDYSMKDPVTETEERSLNINLTRNNSQTIADYINKKTVEYRLENNNTLPDSALIEEWREEIINDLVQKQSYDLPKVLRIYALSTLAYKHKARIEDPIKLIQNILEQQREYVRTNRGAIKTDEIGNPIRKNKAESFKNTKNQFDYFIQVLYGKNKEDEGITNTKVYTSEEKTKKKELNDLLLKLEVNHKAGNISDEDYNSQKGIIENQLDRLGGVAVWSRRGDALLKYVQLKGMGWNLMSSFANVGFGLISNYIEAAGGQLYTQAQLNRAYRMVLGSIGKNATFNKMDVGESKKIRSIMDKWDILKDASKELFQSPLTVETGQHLKWLSPYALTQRTEYINQAPTMIALALNTKINDTTNLWDALDENGNWKEEFGEEPTELISRFRIKLDQLNKMNHGNYDPNSGLLIKNKFWGRAVSQFRSWIFEGYAARFESNPNNVKDSALGVIRKGRYISFIDFLNEVGYKEGSLALIKGFIKGATFGKVFKNADFNEYQSRTLSETDVANMRKVVAELLMYTSIYTSYLMLSAVARGLDPDDDEVKIRTINLLINQGLRLETDLIFYVSPNGFKNLIRDLIPATSLINDTGNFLDAVGRFAQGEDTIGSGVYSGHSRLLRESSQMLPFGTQVYKSMNYGIQTFDK